MPLLVRSKLSYQGLSHLIGNQPLPSVHYKRGRTGHGKGGGGRRQRKKTDGKGEAQVKEKNARIEAQRKKES